MRNERSPHALAAEDELLEERYLNSKSSAELDRLDTSS